MNELLDSLAEIMQDFKDEAKRADADYEMSTNGEDAVYHQGEFEAYTYAYDRIRNVIIQYESAND